MRPALAMRGVTLLSTLLAAATLASCFTREVGDAGADAWMPPGTDADAPKGTDSAPGVDAGLDSGTDSGPWSGVEIGQGQTAFVSAPPGSTVEVHQGPQGGFHIYVTLRITNLDPGDPTLPFGDPAQPVTNVLVVTVEGTAVANLMLPAWYTEVAGAPGTYELVGIAVVLDLCGCAEVAGEPLTVRATVTDRYGATATDARDWMAVESSKCAPPVPPCGT